MVVVFLACLAGCAEMPAQIKQDESRREFELAKQMIYRGEMDAGLAKLKQLNVMYPENAQYRNTLKLQQDAHIAYLLKLADRDVELDRFVKAESAYRHILLIFPGNQRAKEGLAKLELKHDHARRMVDAQAAYDRGDVNIARNRVRTILAEDSVNQAAKSLFEKMDKAQTDKRNNIPKIVSAFNKPITLQMKQVPIKSVFEYIGKAGDLNFIFDQELSTNLEVSLFLRDTPIEEAIEVILTANQLGKKVLNANTLMIYPLSRKELYQELYVRSFYLNNMAAKSAMNLVKTILKMDDVYIDETLNTLVIRDTAESIKIAEKLIASQDLVDPEVMLEVEVMEINHRNLEEIGVRYPTQASLGVQGGSNNTVGNLSLSELKNFNSELGVFTITDPALVFNLLHQDTDTNLLANPKIRVKNRGIAKIHVGEKIPVLTSVANSTGFVSQTVSYIEVGVKLDVEPTILLQDQVSIKIGLEVSNVTDQVRTDSGVLAYTIGTRNVKTTLQLRDGETQILAGLFKDDEQKISNNVPGLSSLPLIGRLFKNKNNDKRKSEIVLLITPHILHNITPANSSYTYFPTGTSQFNSSGSSSGTAQPVQIINPAVAPPIPTDEEVQADQARTAQEFANQIRLQNDEYLE
ncbi:MAG: type II and III secretion system protein [Gammaproteobacteria bacterium]|nr:MAG: type II and III secretion system protein [Gammaproteobacteria bacterium]